MNYKRVGSRFAFRLQHCLSSGAKLFGGLFLTCGTVFTLLQAGRYTYQFRYIVLALAASVVISVVYGVWKARIDHLPDVIIVCDDEDKSYELRYETKNICAHFNRESAKYFARGDYVDDVIVEGWRSKNPHAFVYLKNAKGEPCAALCVFSLRDSFIEQFIKGSVAEVDIEPTDVLDLAGSKKARSLYLAVIIVKEPNTSIGHRRACVMVWAVIQYLKRIFGTKKKRMIYAVPVNKSSENLLKGLGFSLLAHASVRKDRHDLYAFEMTATSLAAALRRIGDHSGCCSISLSESEVEPTMSVSKARM